MKKIKKIIRKKGFTLIELLVVISIISLLSSVVLASVQEARERAEVIYILRGFQEIEKALGAYLIDQNIAKFPTENDLGLGGNPSIQQLINNNVLDVYFTTAPATPFENIFFRYDEDGDDYTCSSPYSGPNILVIGISPGVSSDLNKIIDNDGDLSCGKIRATGNNMTWSLNGVES